MRTKKTRRVRRTAIVPRVVFQTVVAIGVVPCAAALAGCASSTQRTDDAGLIGVAARVDAGADSGFGIAGLAPDSSVFSVALILDAGVDAAFSVTAIQDAGAFAVAVDFDGGSFGVGAPAPDSGFFAVALPAPDSGAIFGVAAPAPDAGVFGVAVPGPGA